MPMQQYVHMRRRLHAIPFYTKRKQHTLQHDKQVSLAACLQGPKVQ